MLGYLDSFKRFGAYQQVAKSVKDENSLLAISTWEDEPVVAVVARLLATGSSL